MHKLYKIILSTMVLCSFAISNAQYTQNAENEIVIGVLDSLYSEILKEQRKIYIHVPEDFDSTKKYPTIYVLDASQNFYSVVGMLKQLIPWKIPNAIIVGITNTDRTRDFTPTNVPFQRGHESKTSGGANNFIKFIDQELKPFINNKYPTENNNTIIGHSTGGLFVLYSYLHHVKSFDNYLAIDPSLWWDKESLVKTAQKQIDKNDYKNKSLYLAVANSIGKAMDTVNVRREKSVVTEQIRANLKFHDVLVKNRKKLDFKWEYFENDDHGSVVVPAQYSGLQSVFSWFPFPEMWRLNTPEDYSVAEMIDPYYVHYKKLSARMKREVKPDWQLVNEIGGFMLQQNFKRKALAFYQMNLDYYTKNSKSHVTLGDYYISQKEESVAVEYYKKAIEIDGNEDAKVKLKKLKDN